MIQRQSETIKSLDEQIIEFLNTLQDNHHYDDQQWIHSLLESRANNIPSEIVKLGMLI